jgi:1,4-dihydroxy-2-naphthoate polyprenyltransferase
VAVAAAALTPARVWWSAVRPATLAASVAPVLTGTAIAIHEGGTLRSTAGLGALVVGLAIQIGVNFANDYSDFKRGADIARVGPVRAASSGLVGPEQVRSAALAAFAVAGVTGLLLSLAIDWRLLIVGAASIAAAWLYTGGPRPYGYLGLGEVFVFVFFGLVATLGTVYVEIGRITALAVWLACAMGFFATAILVLNNLRDIDTDAAAGKRTLATRIGRRQTRVLLTITALAPFACVGVAWLDALAQGPVLASLLALPIAWFAVHDASVTAEPRILVRSLKRVAMAQLAFALLFAFGILL